MVALAEHLTEGVPWAGVREAVVAQETQMNHQNPQEHSVGVQLWPWKPRLASGSELRTPPHLLA